MIKFNDIVLQYSDQVILDNVSIHVKKNSIIGLIGKSGTGKSTILKAFFDFSLIKDGEFWYNDKKVVKIKKTNKKNDFKGYFTKFKKLFKQSSLKNVVKLYKNTLNEYFSKAEIKKYKKKINYIAPDDNLITSIDFYTNFKLTFKKYKNPFYKFLKILTKQQKDNLYQMCEYFGMQDYIFKPVEQLSAGQKQRFAIILNLINDPEILLCDELTSNLDITNAQLVFEYLQKIKSDKYIVVALHNLNDAVKYMDKIIALKDGKIQKIYHPNEYDLDELRLYFD
ncbi:phosphonate transport system ATP-binding protein [Mycoplasmopsis mustelae]|uniref:Phosphonate transport system ATP-binding protein n=1 Tax=Mycoplasmopsis mustelae TaxID=171289 RepID=A0A4R7UDA4_9BACT|nr:ATP-binding cassette domain-containing protein [Mycoplasmopsis mustelae]TDV23545.1 phosphonate transport system ATP-binding protein [Mycoplasmopsis mustelae]